MWQGAAVLRPDFRRCLVQLSRGGADANVVREFDLDTLSFVDDGFTLPEAKSRVGWIDVDRIYVGTDFGPGSLTSSGYPRIIKEWRRGTPLTEAETVFEGKPDDVAVHASHDPTEGFERDFVDRTHRLLLRRVLPAHRRRRAGPDRRTARRGRRRTPGLAAGPHPYAVDVSARPPTLPVPCWPRRSTTSCRARRGLTVLFEPDAHTSLSNHAWTRDHLILNTLSDVKSRLEVLTPGADGWSRMPLAGVPDFVHTEIIGTDPRRQRRVLPQLQRLHRTRHPADRRRRRAGRDAQAGTGVLRRGRLNVAAALRDIAQTARRSRTSWWGNPTGRALPLGRRCSTATAVSRSR